MLLSFFLMVVLSSFLLMGSAYVDPECDKADANGDGRVLSSDYFVVKNHLFQTPCNINNSWCNRSDTDRSGQVLASDYFPIKNHLFENCNIFCNDTCGSLGKECGTYDICGEQINCGTCGYNYICLGGDCEWVNQTCTPTTSCASQGKTCGTIWNGCYNVNCGTCGVGYLCASGSCVWQGGNQTGNETNQTCSNECSYSGQKICLGSYAKICGNYDSDSCLEWNAGTYCPYGCLGGICQSSNQTTNQT